MGSAGVNVKIWSLIFDIKFNYRIIYSYTRFIKIKTEEEEILQNERLEEIRQNHAAKVIQTNWKKFNKKKKKGAKKGGVKKEKKSKKKE